MRRVGFKSLMEYALAGDEYRGGSCSGLVGTLIDCLFEGSLGPLREYVTLVRKRAQEEKVYSLYKMHSLYKKQPKG